MAKLVWDAIGKKLYETGVSHGVLYPANANGTYQTGVAWSGLTAVKESTDGGDENAIYADNGKYVALYGTEEFKCTIEAYTCPEEFKACIGTGIINGAFFGQQKRKRFGFSYMTLVGNDKAGLEYGEKIHLVYGAMAQESDEDHETVNDNPDAMQLSWEITTCPVPVAGFKPTAHLTIDTKKCNPTLVEHFKEMIYGTIASQPRLPSPSDAFAFFSNPRNAFTVTVPLSTAPLTLDGGEFAVGDYNSDVSIDGRSIRAEVWDKGSDENNYMVLDVSFTVPAPDAQTPLTTFECEVEWSGDVYSETQRLTSSDNCVCILTYEDLDMTSTTFTGRFRIPMASPAYYLTPTDSDMYITFYVNDGTNPQASRRYKVVEYIKGVYVPLDTEG